jgi:hypothetical protein
MLDLGHPGVLRLYCHLYLLVPKAPLARDTGRRSMDIACSMLQMIETLKQVFGWSSNTVMFRLQLGSLRIWTASPSLMECLLILLSSRRKKILPKKRQSCHTFQTLLRLYRVNLMPRLLSWLTISLSTKLSGRQHSKFGHTPSNCCQTKPILTTSHPRHFPTHKSYPNNIEGKNLI